MPPGLPGLPKIKLPENPLSPLRKVVHKGHQQIEKAGRDIHSIAEELRGNIPNKTSTIQDIEKASEIEPQSRTASPTGGASKVTSEETIAYQKREIAKELWQLEKHLAQGCRIPDKTGKRIPCDCCEKGSWIAGLAYESIPIAERAGQTSGVFEKIASWSEALEPMVTVAAVEGGQYDYKKLSGEASALRKELMGTVAFNALLPPREQFTLEEAKELATEEATKEVERRWKSQEKKSTT